MKTALFISMAFLIMGSSFTNEPYEFKRPSLTIQSGNFPSNDFNTFLKQFPDIQLPFKIDDVPVTENIVSETDMNLYLIPYDMEIANTGTVKCLGKFMIENRFHGIVFAYYTESSGAIAELFVFDGEGNFQSSVVLGIDYRSYYQTAYVEKDYSIRTEAWFREGDEGGEGKEISNYKIINGIITLD
jgi:hypothetical protein